MRRDDMALFVKSQSRSMKPGVRIRMMLCRLVLVLTATWVLVVTYNVAFPVQGDLQESSDAVVSLAPQVNRLATAEKLVKNNLADTLVISYFEGDVRRASSAESKNPVPVSNYCDTGAQPGIVCFTPKEVATIGEAFTANDLAEHASWDSVTVVTSRSHAFRARYIFERCMGDDIDVNLVYADPDLNVAQWGWRIAYENAAFLKALWHTSTRC